MSTASSTTDQKDSVQKLLPNRPRFPVGIVHESSMKDSAVATAYFVGSLLPAILVAAMGWLGMWHGVLKHNPFIREVARAAGGVDIGMSKSKAKGKWWWRSFSFAMTEILVL